MGKREKREQRKAEREAIADAARAEEAALQEQRRAQFLAELAAERCPKCGSAAVAWIGYGLPRFTPELTADLDAGRVVLGGCSVSNGDPLWVCPDCRHHWGQVTWLPE